MEIQPRVQDSPERAEQAREARLRRAAQRDGLVLRKSRRRNPEALDFGCYWLVNAQYNFLIAGGEWGMSLDEAETALVS